MARNVAWALSNLCRRRAPLEQVPPCLPFFSEAKRLLQRRCLVGVQSSAGRAEPHACRLSAQVQPILLPMWALLHHNDKDVCADICWGLSFFTEGCASLVRQKRLTQFPNADSVADLGCGWGSAMVSSQVGFRPPGGTVGAG